MRPLDQHRRNPVTQSGAVLHSDKEEVSSIQQGARGRKENDGPHGELTGSPQGRFSESNIILKKATERQKSEHVWGA